MTNQVANELIDEFIRRYWKEFDFFDQSARLAAQILEGGLRAAGIRSIVTSRAKAVDRLKEKVLNRASDPKKTYTSVESIFEDIVDLAGVRVAMYFPGEHTQADSIIRKSFNVLAEKAFPDLTIPPQYQKRFSGYRARHYRVQLKADVLSDAQKRYAEAKIEIQVASVLMHSWAEVEHDLLYKPQQGQLSDEEHAILDEINGLVLAVEIALERLQKAGEARVAVRGRKFTNYYDLAAHLLGEFASGASRPRGEIVLGRTDLLFELLRQLNLGTPDKLNPYVQSLTADLEKRPLAEQIIDQLLREDTKRYPIYEKLRTSRPVPGDYVGRASKGSDSDDHREVSQFLKSWVTLEQIIAKKAEELGKPRIYASSALLHELGVSDEMLLKDFDRIKRIRNELVHGLSMPFPEDLRDAENRIQEITDRLK